MLTDRLKMVFTDEEMARLAVCQNESGEPQITVDVHGMRCNQARRYLNNIINITLQSFQLRIIHGYHNGTAIKNMLASDFSNSRIISNEVDRFNPGRTILQLS